ncbi:hypothetical protein BKA63DRAFT_508873 [Paraphoma chrysanthemicola]|nr:hypothetical protein BKA63DRAFT_508873 [Paraphoma chrysanthemicola]
MRAKTWECAMQHARVALHNFFWLCAAWAKIQNNSTRVSCLLDFSRFSTPRERPERKEVIDAPVWTGVFRQSICL